MRCLPPGVDSGVVSDERPSLSLLLFSLSWVSFLRLFLSQITFSTSFLLFSSCACRRFASRTSGSGGFEM